MNSIECMEHAEQDILHTYNRYPIVLEHGTGVCLFDTDGKQYLDFASGIGVCALGYGNEEYFGALKDQAARLIHTSNLFYNGPVIEAAGRLKEASGMDRVFFTTSGAEAIEGAIKAAKKYAYTRDHCDAEFFSWKNAWRAVCNRKRALQRGVCAAACGRAFCGF